MYPPVSSYIANSSCEMLSNNSFSYSDQDTNECLLEITPRDPEKLSEPCVPVQYTNETFHSSHQQEKNITKITACGCKQH